MPVGAQLRSNLNAQRIGSGSVRLSYSWQFTAPETGSAWTQAVALGVEFPNGNTAILFSSDSPSNRSSGSRTHRSNQVGVHTYRFVAIAATDAGDITTAIDSVNIEWLPAVVIVPDPPTAGIAASKTDPDTGELVSISWTSSNATSVSVTAAGGQISTASSGSINYFRRIPTSVTFAITATGPGGTATDSVTVTWSEPPPPDPPTANIRASDTSPNSGESVTISWSSSNTTSVSVLARAEGATSATEISTSTSGSRTYRRTSAITIAFQIIATGPGGTARDSVIVTWSAPPPDVPTASISASDTSPNFGEDINISWSSSNATTASVTANGVRFSTSLSGNISGYSRNTPTSILFEITATGPGGTATDSVTVTWSARPVVATTNSDWSALSRMTPASDTNRAPILREFSDRIVEVNGNFSIDIDDYASDPDGDFLSYAVTGNNNFVAIADLPQGVYRFTGNSVGITTVTVTASDAALSTTRTFSIRVVEEQVGNRPPSIDELPVQFVRLGDTDDIGFPSQRGLSDPDGDYVYVDINYVQNSIYYARVSGGDTIFYEGLQVGIGTLEVFPVDEHGLRGTARNMVIVVYESTAGNRPPVCAPIPNYQLPRQSDTARTVTYDLSSYFSDPDRDRVFIARVDYDRVHGSNVSMYADANNVLHISYATRFAAGVVEITPSDEHGLRGEPCYFVLYIGYNFDSSSNDDRYPAVILPIPNVVVCLGVDFNYELTDYVFSPNAPQSRINYTVNYGPGRLGVEHYIGTTDPTRKFAHITNSRVGISEIGARIRDGYHGDSNNENFFITVEDCSVTTDSEWSTLERMAPIDGGTTDSEWSTLERMDVFTPPITTTDSEWSTLERMPRFIPPIITTNSEWSTLERMDAFVPPIITTDSEWSTLERMVSFIPPTEDGPWSDVLITPTQDGPWSSIITTPTQDGPWSDVLITPTQDGPWSNVLITPTQNGPWSSIIATPTRDGPWSNLVDIVTRDGPWSTVIRDLETTDGPWSDLLGPIINDSLWSPFATLGTQDGPWSTPIGILTEDGPWSGLLGPVIYDSAWSPFVDVNIITPSTYSLWINSNIAHRVRPATVEQVIAHGAWVGSNIAHHARPSAIELVIAHGAWTTSNIAYRVRPAPVELIVAHSLWSLVSAPAFLPRSSNVAQVVYQSAWSPQCRTSPMMYEQTIQPRCFIMAHGKPAT